MVIDVNYIILGTMLFMIPKSAKAKGRRLQQFVRDALRKAFNKSLEDGDVESQLMGGTGEDIVMSPLAKKKIPYSLGKFRASRRKLRR